MLDQAAVADYNVVVVGEAVAAAAVEAVGDVVVVVVGMDLDDDYDVVVEEGQAAVDALDNVVVAVVEAGDVER